MEKTMTYTSNTIAVGAVATPLWFDYLERTSQVAATVLPILGVTWIAVQLIYFLYEKNKRK